MLLCCDAVFFISHEARKGLEMRLNIRDFAKIKEAEIIVDGITVIAGENNTGKSTVGKIIFSIFHALSGIEDKIVDERLKEIESTNRLILQNFFSSLDISRSLIGSNVMRISRRINLQLKRSLDEKKDISILEIEDIIVKCIKRLGNAAVPADLEEWRDTIRELIQNTNEILCLPEESIILEVITRSFNQVFHNQINSLSDNKSMEASLELEIKGRVNQILFRQNTCKHLSDEINIMHKAIYIDNPFIVDELSGYNDLNPMSELLKTILTEDLKEDVFDGIIGTVRAKEKLSDIYETLQSVVDGEIVLSSDEEFYLKNNNFIEPISFNNLSTGLKSFVILKMLLEKGGLKEKDVLILDEPEIHLHPQWQIVYAELIVLLQKYFDLSVIVTTHSPYFMDAINLFSYRYKIEEKVNYYLSSTEGHRIVMQRVTDNIDLIYKKMASPIQMLDTLRYELNNN